MLQNLSLNMCQSCFSIRVLVDALEILLRGANEKLFKSIQHFSIMTGIKNYFKLISDFEWSHIKPIPTYWNLRLSNMHIFTFMVFIEIYIIRADKKFSSLPSFTLSRVEHTFQQNILASRIRDCIVHTYKGIEILSIQ